MTGLWLRRGQVAPGVVRDLFVTGDVLTSPSPGASGPAPGAALGAAGPSPGAAGPPGALGLSPPDTSGPAPAAVVIDLDGRPVLPGLVDHHIHLLALAAAWESVALDPDALGASGGLVPALRAARERRPHGWLRGIGYDVDVSGPLDRAALDIAGAGPVRVQDRTGRLWVLDSAGLACVLHSSPASWPDGVECDGAGEPTGRLWRADGWLRSQLPGSDPDLAAVGRYLASRGVTAVTDAGAHNGPAELAALAAAALPQRLTAMTAAARSLAPQDVDLGPVKILLDDAELPSLDELSARIDTAHAAGRTVAVHCVDAAPLVLALAAGLRGGDRVEHASCVPYDVLPLLAASGATAVVQPGLVATRGDRYLAQHAPAELPALHRLASLQTAGVPVALSSDAPYGDPDPWRTVAAAVRRRTAAGVPFGPEEAISPAAAVAMYATPPDRPAHTARLEPGARVDLVVLDAEWGQLAQLPPVWMTVAAGRIIFGDGPR